jgi:hypothetical protein
MPYLSQSPYKEKPDNQWFDCLFRAFFWQAVENIALFCSAENYSQIEQEVKRRTTHLKT